jgi:hypothetical protein
LVVSLNLNKRQQKVNYLNLPFSQMVHDQALEWQAANNHKPIKLNFKLMNNNKKVNFNKAFSKKSLFTSTV